MRLLLVEDEQGLAESLSSVLRKENYIVDNCYDGESGLDAALSDIYDAVILDVMLPRLNGFDVLKRMRQENVFTPVMMLTARYSVSDKVKGLDIGADDYLTKPFEIEELLARTRALCRRQGEIHTNVLTYGDIELYPAKSTIHCTKTGKSVQIGQKELQLLEYLMLNRNQIVTKEQLFLKVWGYESEAEYNNIEVYISFTRKKIAFIGSSIKIKAIRMIGYELEE